MSANIVNVGKHLWYLVTTGLSIIIISVDQKKSISLCAHRTSFDSSGFEEKSVLNGLSKQRTIGCHGHSGHTHLYWRVVFTSTSLTACRSLSGLAGVQVDMF